MFDRSVCIECQRELAFFCNRLWAIMWLGEYCGLGNCDSHRLLHRLLHPTNHVLTTFAPASPAPTTFAPIKRIRITAAFEEEDEREIAAHRSILGAINEGGLGHGQRWNVPKHVAHVRNRSRRRRRQWPGGQKGRPAAAHSGARIYGCHLIGSRPAR
jgi:hypothetical protein